MAPPSQALQLIETHTDLARLVWRGGHMAAGQTVVASGYRALDQALPGGGWPCGNLIEILQPQPGACEFRLLGPALRSHLAEGAPLFLIAPPLTPYLPGLAQLRLQAHQLIRIDSDHTTDTLWAAEQVLRAGTQGAVLLWLPHVAPDKIRRLQTHAQRGDNLCFTMRDSTAGRQASAAPLRLEVRPDTAQGLDLRILKRRGPLHDTPLHLRALPALLTGLLPSPEHVPLAPQEATDALSLLVGADPASLPG